MLAFAPGITGHCIEENDSLSLELRSLRNLRTVTFVTKDPTIINTIKEGYSPILEDYLGDNLPGFNDVFFEMQEHPIPVDGEERIFNITKNTSMKFCWIPAGEAQLGSPEEERDYVVRGALLEGCRSNWFALEAEAVRGIHKTNGFWLGKYPVTQEQWTKITGKNPSYFKGENLPVEWVSWDDCQDFIKKCSVSGLKLQLPHEDQWEYACQGGKGNKQPFYWGDALNGDKANCCGNYPYGTEKKGIYLAKTTDVGSYEKVAPHPWNLCDMSGNVHEWCENSDTKEGLLRIFRGGSWYSYPGSCRSSCRSWNRPTLRYFDLSFRLVIC